MNAARCRLLVGLLSLPMIAACSDDSPSRPSNGGGPGPGPGSAPMSAMINDVAWAATANISSATFTSNGNTLVVNGLNIDTGSYSMAINLSGVEDSDTYVLHDIFPLRLVVVTTLDGGSWGTTYGDGSGTVTVETLTQDRVAGTFSFTANPAPGSTETGTLVVTDGEFDMALIRLD